VDILAFLGISVLVIVTPGQDTALAIRNSLLGGRRPGVFTALGVSSGQAVWALATSVGLAALIVAFEPAFVALKLAGAAFLVYLGSQALLGAIRGRHVERTHGGGPLTSGVAFRQGVLSNLGNPKMAVFFTSLLPQFGTAFASLLALGLLFSLLTGLWLAAYAVAAARARRLLERDRIRRVLDAVTGAVLVALGLRVAAARG
jgi:threonine/homoserine/homoserine lactone efflux protein